MDLSKRFRGFLPIVIDVETSGVDANCNAILEVGCVFLQVIKGKLLPGDTAHYHVTPFKGAILDPDALEFNKIDPFHPFRMAIAEQEALKELSNKITQQLSQNNCKKGILVGHNAWFDLAFINAALQRCKYKSPLHKFTTLDTATLGATFYSHTVLGTILHRAGIAYDHSKAHGALYDASVTAELFCKIINDVNDLKR